MNNKGFTIIEMVVVIAVFTLIVGAGSGIFVTSIKNQRHILARQEVLDQGSYLMEYMARTLRMARKDTDGTCTGTSKLNYAFESQCIKFRSYEDECKEFCLESGRIKNEDDNYLTSNRLQVSTFTVIMAGENQPPTDYLQPRMTIFLEIEGREQSAVKIQTTISQRNPDVRK